MTTPLDIITLALKDAGVIGVGQTPHSEDANDAFRRLNWMLADWQRKRWLIYHLVDYAHLADGSTSYTVGPGGDFDIISRPETIDSAFFRQTNGVQNVDYPLHQVYSREDYNKIAVKDLASFPHYMFYDTAYPMGSVYFWPVPDHRYEMHLTVKQQLGPFTTLYVDIELPPEYEAAIYHNLVTRLRAGHRLPPDPQLNLFAKDSLDTVRTANAQIPRLHMPGEVVRSGRYNIYTDR
jgi:hypothetical protein